MSCDILDRGRWKKFRIILTAFKKKKKKAKKAMTKL